MEFSLPLKKINKKTQATNAAKIILKRGAMTQGLKIKNTCEQSQHALRIKNTDVDKHLRN